MNPQSGRESSLARAEVLSSEDLVAENIEVGLNAGAYYILTKPFEHAQLRAIIRAAIAAGELRRELEARIDEVGEALHLLTTLAAWDKLWLRKSCSIGQ